MNRQWHHKQILGKKENAGKNECDSAELNQINRWLQAASSQFRYEQNPPALGFYEHLGFQVNDRSERDEQVQPWPILHMKLSQI